MNTQNIPFYNAAYRVFKQLQLKISAIGPTLRAFPLFVDAESFWKASIISEAAEFSTSGHRNARMTAAENPLLKPFAYVVGGNKMVSILTASIMATIQIAADPQLRSLFNQRFNGADVPIYVNTIFSSIRGTERQGITATITAAFNLPILKHFKLEGTIFDVSSVNDDPEKQNLLFSLALGSFLPSYQLKMEKFAVISFNTQHFTVGSISFKYVSNAFQMFINPISTMKANDFMYDPTILEAFMCFFCGITTTDFNNKELDQGSFFTYFEVQINSSNYFPIFHGFFVDRRPGFCNPNTMKNSDRKAQRQNLRDNQNDTAMATMSGVKNQTGMIHNRAEIECYREYYRFLNNVYEISKPHFFKLLRKDRLHKDFSKVFKNINLSKEKLNVGKSTDLS